MILEEIWREKYKETFGLVPKDARKECLAGYPLGIWAAIGYFCFYTLGNLMAGRCSMP